MRRAGRGAARARARRGWAGTRWLGSAGSAGSAGWHVEAETSRAWPACWMCACASCVGRPAGSTTASPGLRDWAHPPITTHRPTYPPTYPPTHPPTHPPPTSAVRPRGDRHSPRVPRAAPDHPWRPAGRWGGRVGWMTSGRRRRARPPAPWLAPRRPSASQPCVGFIPAILRSRRVDIGFMYS